jgi:adenosylhomocysteinase
MPLLERALDRLPPLQGVRLACSMHLDVKMVPLVEGLLERGAQVFLLTCNPGTVQDDVVAALVARGASAEAWRDMSRNAHAAAIEKALDWGPTHLCEMGADVTLALHQGGRAPAVRAGLEATGSGIARLAGIDLGYPVFNWDDLPVKEGLHNRHMVGLTTWHAFFERTRLTLHGKRVLVIGYGLVGRGVADAARAYGGSVCVAERDPVRALEAAYAGWTVRRLDEAIPEADVVVTATGAAEVLGETELRDLKNGAFLLNVGHRSDEIDTATLLSHPHREVLPFVEEVSLGGRTVYLFAGGSMANLTAGFGDSLNAFDVTMAVLVAGLRHITGSGALERPGLHMLPRAAWEEYILPP